MLFSQLLISVKFLLFNKIFIESLHMAHIILHPGDAIMNEEVSVPSVVELIFQFRKHRRNNPKSRSATSVLKRVQPKKMGEVSERNISEQVQYTSDGLVYAACISMIGKLSIPGAEKFWTDCWPRCLFHLPQRQDCGSFPL